MTLDQETVTRLQESLCTTAYTSGTTHNFYHYPARFSPEVARNIIESFSSPGDWILDPFMGGGTSIIEGLTLGRRVVGVDINALAHFVARVRTRPLSENDEEVIRYWAESAKAYLARGDVDWVQRPRIDNLPGSVETFISGALALTVSMAPRQRDFARCTLLRLGQWALDCRDFAAPRRKRLADHFPRLVEEMLDGLRDFVDACGEAGLSRRSILRNRLLLHRSAVDLHSEERLSRVRRRVRLAFTSPPYPGVHVLYHRWQYRGRKETPAPYWIANVHDGYGTSFYCGGSRTPTGIKNYFNMVTGAFKSVADVLADDGHIVQLVGFSNASAQLGDYLQCMEAAGLEEVHVGSSESGRLQRRVPNRKWYAKLKGQVDAANEFLLIHRPKRRS